MVANWLDKIHELLPLETKRTTLRFWTLSESDIDDVYEYGADELTTKMLTMNKHESKDNAIESIRDYLIPNNSFAIVYKENNKVIGSIDLRIDEQNNKVALGYALNRSYWGNGIMSEVATYLVEFCFKVLDANRVSAFHYLGNEGSGKVMQNAGMKYEGILRQDVVVKGIARDCVCYGALKDEWLEEFGK